MKNLYDELGVPTHATLEEIKKAYRKKAQENHPDKGGDTETFQAISKAYEILSDGLKRQQYDETGQTNNRDIENEVITALVSIVLQVVNNNDVRYTNIIHVAETMINAQQGHHKANKRNLETQEARYRDAASRIATTQENNLLADALLSQADNVKGQIEGAKTTISIGEKILQILGNYDYTVEMQPPQVWYTHGASTTSGLTWGR